jgi:transcriptional regulator with XRE-family HTH domain
MNKIFKLIREFKKMTIPQIAEILGVHHSAVGAFELYGHGLGVEKIAKYASLLGFSVSQNEISFTPNVVHVYYLPVLAGLRKVNLEPFFDFIRLCNITTTQIVLFTEKKHTKAILVQDLQE